MEFRTHICNFPNCDFQLRKNVETVLGRLLECRVFSEREAKIRKYLFVSNVQHNKCYIDFIVDDVQSQGREN